jgi:hypothetical protein
MGLQLEEAERVNYWIFCNSFEKKQWINGDEEMKKTSQCIISRKNQIISLVQNDLVLICKTWNFEERENIRIDCITVSVLTVLLELLDLSWSVFIERAVWAEPQCLCQRYQDHENYEVKKEFFCRKSASSFSKN